MCRAIIFIAKIFALIIVVLLCAIFNYVALHKHIVPVKSQESYTVFMRNSLESTSHHGLVKLDNAVLSAQSYLVIEVVASQKKYDMFEICLDVANGVRLTDRSCQTTMIPVYSPSIETIKWIMHIPMYIFGAHRESILVKAELFSDLQFKTDMYPLTLMSIEIRPVNFKYYGVRVELTANLSGLEYVLVYWPYMSFIMGTGSFISFIWIIVVIFFYFFYKVRRLFRGVGRIPVGRRGNVRG